MSFERRFLDDLNLVIVCTKRNPQILLDSIQTAVGDLAYTQPKLVTISTWS